MIKKSGGHEMRDASKTRGLTFSPRVRFQQHYVVPIVVRTIPGSKLEDRDQVAIAEARECQQRERFLTAR